MKGLLLSIAWIMSWFLLGCGDVTVSSDNENDNQQTQNEPAADGDKEDVSDAEACKLCVGNPEDDQTDADCLAGFGLAESDCER